jgi:hypothetical protein
MGFANKVVVLSTQPVVPASIPGFGIHSLLNNGPLADSGKKEDMMIELVPILNGSAVHFGGHAARVYEFLRV